MDIELSAGLAIAHRVTGADYQGLAVDDTVAVKVIDDDKPRIVVMDDPPSATIDEGDEDGVTYMVKLRTQPTGDVTVTVTAPSELTVDPATLTFTPDDWETAQAVTVTAVDDDDALPPGTGTVDYTITHSATGGGYDAAPGDTFTAKVDDDGTRRSSSRRRR